MQGRAFAIFFLFFWLISLPSFSQNELGKAARFEGRFQMDSALHYYQKAVGGYAKGSLRYYEIHLAMARCLNRLGVFEEALKHSQLVIDGNKLEGNQLLLAEAHTEKGISFYRKNLNQQAVESYYEAINIYKTHFPSDQESLVKLNFHLGVAYYYLYEDEKAQSYYFRSLELASLNGLLNVRIIPQLYLGIANSYWAQGDLGKSFIYLNMAQNLERAYRTPDQLLLGKIYHTMAYNFFDRKVYDSALWVLKKAEPLILNTCGKKHPNVVWLFGDLCRAYSFLGNYNKAIEYAQKGLAANVLDFNETVDISKNPQIEQVIDAKQHVMVLKLKVEVLISLYDKSKDEKYLQMALETAKLGDQMVVKTKREIVNSRDKISMGTAAVEIYDQAILAALKFYEKTKNDEYAELAFSYSEKNKASVALSSISEKNAMKYAGLPDAVLEEEFRLKEEIDSKRAALMPMAPSHSRYSELMSDLSKLNKAYQMYIKKVESGYPKYFQLKYNNKVSSITEVREDLLLEDEALIEYYWGTQNFYIFYISKESKTVYKKNIPANLDSLVMGFRDNIIDKKASALAQKSVELYQLLWSDVHKKLEKEEIERIYVVPDGRLGFIPFGLLKEEPNSKYLIENFKISYQYSATLASFAKKRIPERYSRTFGGFAPEFDVATISQSAPEEIRRNMLGSLPGAQREVNEIAKFLDVKTFIGEEASEGNFKNEAHKFRILHFASHAWTDEQNPESSRLVFSTPKDSTEKEDGYLFPYEIYGLDLNAELVTLSACNTGFGKHYQGEGIISLGHAFNYAGCSNLVMSLWPVPDASTSIIMTSFYTYLSKGYDKDESLHRAKLDFLEQANERESSPYYWAGFVFVGNPQNMFPKTTDYKQLMIIGGMVLLIILLSVYYIKNNV